MHCYEVFFGKGTCVLTDICRDIPHPRRNSGWYCCQQVDITILWRQSAHQTSGTKEHRKKTRPSKRAWTSTMPFTLSHWRLVYIHRESNEVKLSKRAFYWVNRKMWVSDRTGTLTKPRLNRPHSWRDAAKTCCQPTKLYKIFEETACVTYHYYRRSQSDRRSRGASLPREQSWSDCEPDFHGCLINTRNRENTPLGWGSYLYSKLVGFLLGHSRRVKGRGTKSESKTRCSTE